MRIFKNTRKNQKSEGFVITSYTLHTPMTSHDKMAHARVDQLPLVVSCLFKSISNRLW